MRFGAYIVLVISMSVVFYFLGYTSIASNLMNKQGDQFLSPQCPTDTPDCNTGVIDKIILLGGVALAGTAIASLIGGFGVLYIIPMLILMAILEYFIFPFSFIIDNSLDPMIGTPLILFLNMFTILSIVNFIRGGV